jgi:hypothetical protein
MKKETRHGDKINMTKNKDRIFKTIINEKRNLKNNYIHKVGTW